MAQTAAKTATRAHAARRPRQRQSVKRIALRVLADGLAVSASLFLASAIRFDMFPGGPARGLDYTVITLIVTPIWLLLFWMYGLYEPRQVLSPISELKQVFHGVIGGSVLLFVADSVLNLNLARAWVLIVMLCGIVIVGSERIVVRKSLHFLRRRGSDTTRTIIVGTNDEARTVARTLQRESWLGYRIVGFVDDRLQAGEMLDEEFSVIGTSAELKSLVGEHSASLVLVAATAVDATRINRLFWELQDADVDLQITSGTIDLMASRMTVQSVAGVPLLYVRRTGMDRIQRTIKRTMDILGAMVLGMLLLPLLFAIMLWVRRDSDGPAIFRQIRVGRGGEQFVCWKFRTMYLDAEKRRAEIEHLNEGPGFLFKLKDDPRITNAGRVLRRRSLDELPQLWNVLKGEMSLIGPRPAIPSEVEHYDEWVRNRLKVKPGMTGLWQVSGRTETSFSDYVRYDLFYIQNWSLSLDIWIAWRTLRAVLGGEGAH